LPHIITSISHRFHVIADYWSFALSQGVPLLNTRLGEPLILLSRNLASRN